MNLLLLDPGEVAADGTARLSGRRADHLLDVIGAAPGTRVPAGVLGGRMGQAEVLAVSGRELEVAVRLDRDPPPPSPVSLLLALPRPKVLHRVVQAIAAAGVKRAVLLGAWRVEKSYWSSPRLEPAALAGDLRLGLEQGRDTVLPEIRLRRLFKPFVEDQVDEWCGSAVRLLADPDAGRPIEAVGSAATRAALAVGPEGGFSDYEVERLRERGFAPFSLGPRALRVEDAVPFAVGQAELWLRRGGPGLRLL